MDKDKNERLKAWIEMVGFRSEIPAVTLPPETEPLILFPRKSKIKHG